MRHVPRPIGGHRPVHELAEVGTGTLGGTTVVRGEHHDRVVEFAEGLDGVEDPADRFVHAVHHRRVDLLIPLVTTLLVVGERRPLGCVISRFDVPGRHLGLRREESGTLLRLESVLSHRIPPFGILPAEPVQILRFGLMRTVHRDVREVQEGGLLDIHGVGSKSDRRARVAALLDLVQLPRGFADRRPHELSGGQRQRVALARALALRPTVLIAAEPTSALDVSIQANVLELFRELQQELGFAAVFISHDLAVVEQVADHVSVLRAGKLVEYGRATAVLTKPTQEYTQALLRAVPVPDPAIQRQRRAIA